METVRERTDAVGHPMPAAVTCAQATVLALLVVAGSQLLWMPELAHLAIRDGNVTAIDARTLACVAILAVPAWAMATMALAAAAKWTIIGRYRPMRVRAWSWWHLRHWTVIASDGTASASAASARSTHGDGSSGTWPMTDTERTVAQAIADVLGVPGAVHPDADFFDDLGLDSLTVAMVVSRLRADPRTRAANVRMTYAHRTVRAAAAAIDGATGPGTMDTVRERTDAVGHPMPAAVTCAQATMLALLVVAGSQLLWMPELAHLAIRDGNVTAIDARTLACMAMLAVPAWAIATVVLAAAAKWMIIGRYRPMRVRAWSWWHLRHWTVVR
ncbi:MAG: phosphopantetheine-binding protein, partial [Phycisphaerales bacterium]